jgi:hypothetical protein
MNCAACGHSFAAGYAPPAGQPPPFAGYGPPAGWAPPPVQNYGYAEHPDANTALVFGILSIFCCCLLAPVAIIKGSAVKQAAAMNPGMMGGDKGNIAVILGYVAIGLWVMSFIARLGLGAYRLL